MHIAHVRVQDMHTIHGIHVLHDCHLAQSSLFVYFTRVFSHVSRAIDRSNDRTGLEIRAKSDRNRKSESRNPNSDILKSEIRFVQKVYFK